MTVAYGESSFPGVFIAGRSQQTAQVGRAVVNTAFEEAGAWAESIDGTRAVGYALEKDDVA